MVMVGDGDHAEDDSSKEPYDDFDDDDGGDNDGDDDDRPFLQHKVISPINAILSLALGSWLTFDARQEVSPN